MLALPLRSTVCAVYLEDEPGRLPYGDKGVVQLLRMVAAFLLLVVKLKKPSF